MLLKLLLVLPYELDLGTQLQSNLADSPEISSGFVLQEVIFFKENSMLMEMIKMNLSFRQLYFNERACRQFVQSSVYKRKQNKNNQNYFLLVAIVGKDQQLEIRSEQRIHSESPSEPQNFPVSSFHFALRVSSRVGMLLFSDILFSFY